MASFVSVPRKEGTMIHAPDKPRDGVYRVGDRAAKSTREMLLWRELAVTREVSAIGHPSLPSKVEWSLVGSTMTMYTPWAPGGDLVRLCHAGYGKVLSVDEIDTRRRIVLQLEEALCAAHKRGWYHHDVSLENVVLMGDGRPVLIDWASASGNPTEEYGGKDAYMNPNGLFEDWFALGVLYFALLHGYYPFNDRPPKFMSRWHATEWLRTQRRPFLYPTETSMILSFWFSTTGPSIRSLTAATEQ